MDNTLKYNAKLNDTNLYCFEEFSNLLFYTSMSKLPLIVVRNQRAYYYTDGPNVKFKDWNLTLFARPYFEQLNALDIPKVIPIPLRITKFIKIYEEN